MADKLYKNPYDVIKVPRFNEEAGFYTTKQRSQTMSKIRSKNSKPEMMLRKALWKANLRYRTHVKNLPGTPDIVIKKYKLAVFVDGEFWHGYNWEQRRMKIKTNRAFWIPKIERNMQRDEENRRGLEESGFTVMRFWEHEVKKALEKCVNQIMLYVESARILKVPSSEGDYYFK